MIQTAVVAQELFSKAALVNYAELASAQNAVDLVRAETCLQDAFATDVRPVIQEWRQSKGLPADPLQAFRESGYLQRIEQQRGSRNMASLTSYA